MFCVHSAGQCSSSQSVKHRLIVRTRKVALEYTAFTGKRVVENAKQFLHFNLEVCNFLFTKSLLFNPVDVP